MSAEQDKRLSVREVARLWGVAPKKVRDYIRSGVLKAFDVGKARPELRISPEAISRAEELLSVGPAPEQQKKRRGTVSPTVKALLGL